MAARSVFTQFNQLWLTLTRPSVYVKVETQRHQAFLLSSLALTLLLAGVIVFPTWIITNPEFTTAPLISLAVMGIFGMSYGLSRTRYYQYGSVSLIAAVLFLVAVVLIAAPDPISERLMALNFLLLAVLLTSILLSVRAALFITGASLLLTASFIFVPTIRPIVVFSYLVFITAMSALIIVDVSLRSRSARQLAQAEAQYRSTQKGLSIAFNPDSDLPAIMGDGVLLQEAFGNLLDNAVRFTPDGGVISVSSYSQTGYAVIEFKDSGVGISDESLPHIFKRFWRQDAAHSTPGVGLGLSITLRIMEMHNGRIEVESQLGSGSIFKVLLPIPSQLESQPNLSAAVL